MNGDATSVLTSTDAQHVARARLHRGVACCCREHGSSRDLAGHRRGGGCARRRRPAVRPPRIDSAAAAEPEARSARCRGGRPDGRRHLPSLSSARAPRAVHRDRHGAAVRGVSRAIARRRVGRACPGHRRRGAGLARRRAGFARRPPWSLGEASRWQRPCMRWCTRLSAPRCWWPSRSSAGSRGAPCAPRRRAWYQPWWLTWCGTCSSCSGCHWTPDEERIRGAASPAAAVEIPGPRSAARLGPTPATASPCRQRNGSTSRSCTSSHFRSCSSPGRCSGRHNGRARRWCNHRSSSRSGTRSGTSWCVSSSVAAGGVACCR